LSRPRCRKGRDAGNFFEPRGQPKAPFRLCLIRRCHRPTQQQHRYGRCRGSNKSEVVVRRFSVPCTGCCAVRRQLQTHKHLFGTQRLVVRFDDKRERAGAKRTERAAPKEETAAPPYGDGPGVPGKCRSVTGPVDNQLQACDAAPLAKMQNFNSLFARSTSASGFERASAQGTEAGRRPKRLSKGSACARFVRMR